ncbi:hemin ABC transporter substrate-binding protein [Lentzea sp. NPDC058436]|uniref:heme/hemin ABC transporter substrate-binding protein n=1 Tax=Lentzea sp. NPDC058436 TaxID=3346499 RepID=UPI0036647A10
MRTWVVVLAVALVAGCTAPANRDVPQATSSSAEPLKDPRQKSGPSTAKVSDVEPITGEAAPKLPTTVTDAQNTQVTVASADRILAVDRHGTLAATVHGLGLGQRMVGRDASAGLPLVTTNGHELDLQTVTALRPTVVLTDTTLGPQDVVQRLRDSGIPVVVTDSRRALNNVGTLIQQVADALGVPGEGEKLAHRTTVEVQKAQITAQRLADGAELRIVFLHLREGVHQVLGEGTGADELITGVGGVDVATEAGLRGAVPISPEAVAGADVILVMSQGLAAVGGVDGLLGVPGVAATPAGQKRRVVDVDDHRVLSFGPLTGAVINGVAGALYL